MFVMTGYYLSFKDPHNQTDAELKQAQKLLIAKKHLVRLIWSSETDMDNAFASGDLWIAYAWPNDWVIMKSKGLKVRYMYPKEKPISWIGMLMLGKSTPRYHLAHAFADAWSSRQSGAWLEDNYGYGHANTLARPKSSDLLRALKLTNPKAVTAPNAHIDTDVPQRAKYNKLWEEVKAS
jgi:spermidine/putrescine transport system substrate-binding protein